MSTTSVCIAGGSTYQMRTASSFAEVFEERGMPALRQDLASLLDMSEDEAIGDLPAIGEELMFHLITNPAIRQNLLLSPDEVIPDGGGTLGGLSMSASTPAVTDLHSELLALGSLSERIRQAAE